ncbi:10235_t:CDS:1 [Ambispora gerdemannii]|uniref:10235_t:CDS:1 n=1 Tax=Ambispora gerdemannii TaxID=144530 RepID=A0A9N8WPH3_9GLOM|nr:10235_t:CDS:1 [Ambispora gerdemannii]
MKNVSLFFVVFSFVAITLVFASLEPLPGGWRRSEATLLDQRSLVDKTHTVEKRVNAQITYYEGQDLKNSACYGRNGLPVYNARPTDMIAAMAMSGLDMCYKCIEIKNHKKKVVTIIVKVIDICGGCPPGKNNVDLTKTAFSKLANPIDGRVEIVWRPLPNCPTKGKWPKFEKRKH